MTFGIKNNIYPVVGIVLLIVMAVSVAVYFLTQSSATQPSTDTGTNTTNDFDSSLNPDPTKPAKQLLLDNKTTIELNSTTVELLNDWQLEKAWLGVAGTDYVCNSSNPDNCRVYEISKDDSTFYIANQSFLVEGLNTFDRIAFRSFNTFQGEIEMAYVRVAIPDPDEPYKEGFEPLDYFAVRQAYYCFAEDFCVSSGILPIEKAENTVALSNFEEFLTSLSIK